MKIERLSAESAQDLMSAVPVYVKDAFEQRAIEIDYPLEALVEMALANFLDDEAISFEDCLLSKRMDAAA